MKKRDTQIRKRKRKKKKKNNNHTTAKPLAELAGLEVGHVTIGRSSSSSKVFLFLFFSFLFKKSPSSTSKNLLQKCSFENLPRNCSSSPVFFSSKIFFESLLPCLFVLKFKSLWRDSGWTNGGMAAVSPLAVPIFSRSGFHE